MTQAAPHSDVTSAFEQAQRSVRRSREASREAAQDLAKFRDALREAGIRLEHQSTNGHGPDRGEGENV